MDWCSNSCGNIYEDNATICHELWVSIKNVCVCNYLGANNCPDDFRAQLLNTVYCANGPDLCDPCPTPSPISSPTPSPTALTIASPPPTKNSHPCGNDSCQHTCKIFPDPNYITWSNHYFAFHGSCDQIAIDNDNIQVLIRTEEISRFSTITAVGIFFKITDETFYYYYDSDSRRYVTENNLSPASVQSFANNKITINDANVIKLRSDIYGVTLEVLGSGGYMFGSVGMCGSWNNGHARYRNGDIFDTTGGFGPQTYNYSYGLAQDWKATIPIHQDSEMSLPLGSGTCVDQDFSYRGLRTPSKINAVHAGCQEKTCDKIQSKLFRKACEADIAITGDMTWACADILMNHEAILEASPSDFELTESIEEFYRQAYYV